MCSDVGIRTCANVSPAWAALSVRAFRRWSTGLMALPDQIAGRYGGVTGLGQRDVYQGAQAIKCALPCKLNR